MKKIYMYAIIALVTISIGILIVHNNASSTDATTCSCGDNIVCKDVSAGIIMCWNGTTAPSGWYICDGTSGTPDLRSMFIVGYNASDSDYNAIGNTGGEKKHNLTIDELPWHIHTILNAHNGLSPTTAGRQSSTSLTIRGVTSFRYTYTTDETTENTGDGTGHENRPPYYVLAYIMKG